MPSGSGALRVAFGEPVEVLATDTLDQVKAVLQAVEERALRGQWCVGYVRYEAAPAFDHALAVHATTGPLVWFGVHDAPRLGLAGEPQPVEMFAAKEHVCGSTRKRYRTQQHQPGQRNTHGQSARNHPCGQGDHDQPV